MGSDIIVVRLTTGYGGFEGEDQGRDWPDANGVQ